MKRYILFILLLTASLSGCKEQEVPTYSDTNQRINFMLVNRTYYTYPEYLKDTVNFLDPNYINLDEVPVLIYVQSQGFGNDSDRKIVFKAKTITGVGGALQPYEYILPAGQDTASFNLMFSGEGLVAGKDAIIEVEFDLDKSDFMAGVDERQLFTLNARKFYIPESVGLTMAQWVNNYAGMLWGGFEYDPGYGPWSSAKAAFIVETLGITNFLTDLPNSYTEDVIKAVRQQLRDALEEYKERNRQDPETYPPLIDEVKGNEQWIAFEVE